MATKHKNNYVILIWKCNNIASVIWNMTNGTLNITLK